MLNDLELINLILHVMHTFIHLICNPNRSMWFFLQNLQQRWCAEPNTVKKKKKKDLLLAGIKALQEERISISRVTITELLISSLGLLSGPFSRFINELSLGYLQGSSTHSWFIMCNMVNRRGVAVKRGLGVGQHTLHPPPSSSGIITSVGRENPHNTNAGTNEFANKQMKVASQNNTCKAGGWRREQRQTDHEASSGSSDLLRLICGGF